MVNHRDNVKWEVERYLQHHYNTSYPPYMRLQNKIVLEIGHGEDDTFKKIFVKQGAIYYCIDKGESIESDLNIAIEDLQKPFCSADLIFCCHSFEHTENPTKFLQKCWENLKENGHILIITPNHCLGQTLDNADDDHINVLTEYQMRKFLLYTNYDLLGIYTQSYI